MVLRKWKIEIDSAVNCVGLSKWKTEEEQKTLEWFREKEILIYVWKPGW